jgi:SAM-dependent methyltransferase
MPVMYRLVVWWHRSERLYRWRNRALVWTARRRHQPVLVRDYIARYAPGGSFVDIGGMFGIAGDHSFLAEEAGASRVALVDTTCTPEFERKRSERGSKVEYIQADASGSDLAETIGVFDTVWCFGVLYHHPAPHDLLANLRTVCGERLVLETLVIPDVPGFPNMATYYPYQPPKARARWNTVGEDSTVRVQLGITTDFDPRKGYANNFWGMSPSCVEALLRSVGFTVESSRRVPRSRMRHVFVARV